MNLYLSIIIPAYNENERIGPTLDAIKRYLSIQPYTYEVTVVDDGSTDTTGLLVKNRALTTSFLSLITLPKNQGKGEAVRIGMLSARGELRLYMDADGSTSIEELEKLMPYAGEGYDIVVGSRRISGAVIKVKQNVLRDILGWIFRSLVHALFSISVVDTQNGFKLFSKRAAESIFSSLKTRTWSFDVETLVLAKTLGLRVKEVPIVWINDGRSKLRLFDTIQMLAELIALKWKQSI